jgi:hypothetical protein
VVVDTADDGRSTDIESSSPSTSFAASVQSPGNEGYYMRQPYPLQSDHLHRLPSPKCWSVTASSARMPFPQFPVDPYLYWRHVMESGAGKCMLLLLLDEDSRECHALTVYG